MTIQQLAMELHNVPASGIEDWMDLRAERIAALPDVDMHAVVGAVNDLKRWRHSLALLQVDG